MFRKIGLGLLMLSSAGCFGNKSLECASVNWTQQGLEDGKKGFDETKVLELKRKCEDQGVAASVVDYKQGWLVGIGVFCSPHNAFRMGKEGQKVVKDNCPVEFKTNFAESFKRGQELKKINDELGPFKKKVSDLKQEREELAQRTGEIETELSKIESIIIELNQKKENIKRLSEVLEPDDVIYKGGHSIPEGVM